MATKPAEQLRRFDNLREGLRRAGVKLTHQRLEICREIANAGNHPDAEAVYAAVRGRIPTISLDTVYRALWLLLDLGLIGTLGTPRERMRFDGNNTPHHHFICTKCGEAQDFYSEDLDRLIIPDQVNTYGEVQRVHIEVRGICLKCLENTNPWRAVREKERK